MKGRLCKAKTDDHDNLFRKLITDNMCVRVVVKKPFKIVLSMIKAYYLT